MCVHVSVLLDEIYIALVCDFRCGLVALWMASHLLQPPQMLVLETLVQTAKNNGYTEQGEMFSGTNICF